MAIGKARAWLLVGGMKGRRVQLGGSVACVLVSIRRSAALRALIYTDSWCSVWFSTDVLGPGPVIRSRRSTNTLVGYLACVVHHYYCHILRWYVYSLTTGR
jgi:hypothetical protein